LAAGTEYLRSMQERGLSALVVAPRIRFSFAVGPQFFVEVAKFRAFRGLWSRVLEAYGVPASAMTARLHARTARANQTVLDVHVNMLRVTTEALSAVLGGVDSMHISPYDEVLEGGDEFSRRVARNVHTLLAEEFQLKGPVDPAGGSWYVEKVTDELGRKAWALFQEVEKLGGYSQALLAGFMQTQVANSAADRKAAVEMRRNVLVGTNMFPNAKDKMTNPPVKTEAIAHRGVEIAGRRPTAKPVVGGDWSGRFAGAVAEAGRGVTVEQLSKVFLSGAHPSVVVPAVKPWRWAAGIEALRAATEKNGRPKLFVAKMGPVAQHKARADFAAGFFNVAGFELIAKQSFETAEQAAAAVIASEVKVAVLCSTDETYPALAPAFVQAVKKARPATLVVLAGYPTEQIEAYKAAGFDEFIHVRANVRETLVKILQKIGITV
jgi:methylmalonyl-CoA mutase